MQKKQLCRLGLVLSFLLLSISVQAQAEGVISVQGQAELFVEPDQVKIELAVVTEATTATKAQQKNTSTTKQVLDQLIALDIPDADIKSTNFTLLPKRVYDREQGTQKIVGYQATSQIIVKLGVEQFAQIGDVIVTAVTAGVTNVANITFTVTDANAWQMTALELATENAKQKAETLAAAAGVKIKGVTSIRDNHVAFIPYRLQRTEAFMAADKAALAPEINPEGVQIQAQISMEFAF